MPTEAAATPSTVPVPPLRGRCRNAWQEAVPAALNSSVTRAHAFPITALQAPRSKRATGDFRPGDSHVIARLEGGRRPPALLQFPESARPAPSTAREAAALAVSRAGPAHLCPRPFRPSLPLRPVSRRRRRRRLAQLVGSLYKGKTRADRTAGAAAGGGSGGVGSGDRRWFPSWARGGERATPPGPPKGLGFFFFFLKGDSRGF